MTLPEDIRTERTLCFLIRDNHLLLALKKKDKFGASLYNGFGGKRKTGETILQAATREIYEESGLIVEESDLAHRAILDFYFPAKPEWNQRVQVYFVRQWEGTPVETDEMYCAESFPLSNLPYDKMFKSDVIWLKELLTGRKFHGIFYWADDNKTVKEYVLHDLTDIS